MLHLKKAILVTLVLCAAATAAALECRVVLPDGSALSGARVTVIGRSELLVADGDGRFDLDPVPEIPFVLFIARPDGVALRPVTVAELPEEGPLTVEVAPVGETVTVVSGVIPDLELPPAVAATVMGRGDLGQRLPAQLFWRIYRAPAPAVTATQRCPASAACPSIAPCSCSMMAESAPNGAPEHRRPISTPKPLTRSR